MKVNNTSVNFLLDFEDAPDTPYIYASTTLARCKDRLTEEGRKKIIKFLLED